MDIGVLVTDEVALLVVIPGKLKSVQNIVSPIAPSPSIDLLYFMFSMLFIVVDAAHSTIWAVHNFASWSGHDVLC